MTDTSRPAHDPLTGIDAAVIERARGVRLLLEAKTFHVHDGHGLKMLQGQGLPVGIITSRESPLVARRAAELGIKHLFQGCSDKRVTFSTLLQEMGLDAGAVAYVGDDVIDLPVMTGVGLAIAVADAHPEVRARAHWVTAANGGRGAVRETCDLLLATQGLLGSALAPYLV